ncbi:hypothetical protein SLS53_002849 [Cytospora paraplurivora]|uniref:Uncharacterized protein n=1 Tax=Cytospora paraplurivora TaxID=2898453 RepID=A0AAN9YHQ8_9PEZI
MAMNEAEPSAIAAQSKNLLASLRALQHKDINGNVITDPDVSNPTRSIDRRQSPAKRDPANDFGIGFSQAAEYQPSAFSVAGQGGPQSGQDNGGGAPPAVPPKAGSLLRKATTQESRPKPGEGEKRKSWFKRIGKK